MKRQHLIRFGVLGLAAIAILLANVFIASADPLTMTLTLNSSGTVNRIGQVTVSGTLTCDLPGTSAFLNGQVTQLSGRAQLSGSFFTNVPCGPTPTPWAATLTASNGIFTGGPAVANVNGSACTFNGYFFECTFAGVPNTNIRLKGGF